MISWYLDKLIEKKLKLLQNIKIVPEIIYVHVNFKHAASCVKELSGEILPYWSTVSSTEDWRVIHLIRA